MPLEVSHLICRCTSGHLLRLGLHNLQGKQARLKAEFHSHGLASAPHAAMYSAPDAVINTADLCDMTRHDGRVCRQMEAAKSSRFAAI